MSLISLFLPTAAHAAPVYGTSAPAAGSRVIGADGLSTDDGDWADARVEWLVSAGPSGTFQYTYTFTNFDRPAIGHMVLDLDGDATVGAFKINGAAAGPQEFGNFDGIGGAVKFDAGDAETLENLVTYSFVSDRGPAWGNLFVKAGRTTTLSNTGLFDAASSNVLDFVATPGGGTAVGEPSIPEPGTGALALVAATGLLARRRRS